MKIKKLLEIITGGKIKKISSLDSKTYCMDLKLTKQEKKEGYADEYFISYSELIGDIKEWALHQGYFLTSGTNKAVLEYEEDRQRYYNNLFIANISKDNNDLEIIGFSELNVTLKAGIKILKFLKKNKIQIND